MEKARAFLKNCDKDSNNRIADKQSGYCLFIYLIPMFMGK